MAQNAIRAVLGLLGLALSAHASAQIGNPAPETGLGGCVDLVAASSDTMASEINNALDDMWTFQYSNNGSATSYNTKTVFIHQYSCDQNVNPLLYRTVSLLSHELGHVKRGHIVDESSRDSYIKSECTNEGYAVGNNIVGKNEISEATSNYINLIIVASNPQELETIFNSQSPPNYKSIGDSFCDNNKTSTTHENYRKYYGAIYDGM